MATKIGFAAALQSQERFLTFLAKEINADVGYQTLRRQVAQGSHPSEEELYDYVLDWLDEHAAGLMRDHLVYCGACAEEALRIRFIEAELESRVRRQSFKQRFQRCWKAALKVTGVYGWEQVNFTNFYHQKPLMETLFAAQDMPGLTFPVTVAYREGAVVGQFWRRQRQLWYRLKHVAPGHQPQEFVLLYQAGAAAEKFRLFELTAAEILLGEFRAFFQSETTQDMLETLKHFRLACKI